MFFLDLRLRADLCAPIIKLGFLEKNVAGRSVSTHFLSQRQRFIFASLRVALLWGLLLYRLSWHNLPLSHGLLAQQSVMHFRARPHAVFTLVQWVIDFLG